MLDEMNKKEYSFTPCDICEEDGVFFVDNLEEPVFLRCHICNFETSDVFCSECGMGGPFIKEISNRPNTWICPDCHREYELPKDFYNSPTVLYPESKLPKGFLKDFNNKGKVEKKSFLSRLFSR